MQIEGERDIEQFPFATAINNKFAEFTLQKRLPDLIERLMLDSKTGRSSWTRLSQLRENLIEKGRVPPLEQNPHFDPKIWESITESVRSWRTAPFINFEYYLYYKILEATGSYFHFSPLDGSNEKWQLGQHDKYADPFYLDKTLNPLEVADAFWSKIVGFSQSVADTEGAKRKLQRVIYTSLLNNQLDASQIRQFGTAQFAEEDFADRKDVRVDHSDSLIERILDKKTARIDVVCDNFPHEFVSDLLLCNTILDLTDAKVTVWVKNLPSFVSDVTITDWIKLREALRSAPDPLSNAFSNILRTGSFSVESARHLDSHLSFSDALDPENTVLHSKPLSDLFNSTDLLIIKGDLNYRKLVGDRLWSPHLQVKKRIKAPIFCIRAVKSACLAGVKQSDWPITLESLNRSLPSIERPKGSEDYRLIIQEF